MSHHILFAVHVSWVIYTNYPSYLLLLFIPSPLNLLFQTFGVSHLLFLTMASNTMSHLWMPSFDIYGFIFLKPNLIYIMHLFTSRHKQNYNLILRFWCFSLIFGRQYKRLSSFLDQHGVVFRQTCPYTSEQNGIVERKHRHVCWNWPYLACSFRKSF